MLLLSKTLVILILLFSINLNLHAKLQAQAIEKFEQIYSFKSYNEAEAASDQLLFTMKSTKFGLITTSFQAYVKSFIVSGEVNNDNYQNISIAFPAKSIDTDVDARNEKMLDLCLEEKKYPTITVTIPGPLKLTTANYSDLDATILLRGKNRPFKISFEWKKENNNLIVSGKATLKLSELEIPDPSIAIAKVEDEININFKISLNLTSKL
ncbi:MAG: YceI family protein [Oligoflexia bacterium]|nr:YceI family protein [Oligoflexia bacterium]